MRESRPWASTDGSPIAACLDKTFQSVQGCAVFSRHIFQPCSLLHKHKLIQVLTPCRHAAQLMTSCSTCRIALACQVMPHHLLQQRQKSTSEAMEKKPAAHRRAGKEVAPGRGSSRWRWSGGGGRCKLWAPVGNASGKGHDGLLPCIAGGGCTQRNRACSELHFDSCMSPNHAQMPVNCQVSQPVTPAR